MKTTNDEPHVIIFEHSGDGDQLIRYRKNLAGAKSLFRDKAGKMKRCGYETKIYRLVEVPMTHEKET